MTVRLFDGSRLIEGKTIIGFANVEEDFGDAAFGQRGMPFRIEDEARKRGANYVQAGLFKAFAIRDNQLITGQQQYSGTKVAQLVMSPLESEPPPPPLSGHAAETAREGRRVDHAATRPSTPQSPMAEPLTYSQASLDNLDRVLAA
jgi:hypothetical protein